MAPNLERTSLLRPPSLSDGGTSAISLHLDLLLQALRVAEDRRKRGGVIAIPESDRHVAVLGIAIDVNLLRSFRVSDIID